MSQSFTNLQAINVQYATALEHKLQESFDSRPQQNFVTKDYLFYQDSERSARAAVTWLHEKKAEKEKFLQDADEALMNKLQKLWDLQRRHSKAPYDEDTNARARQSDKFVRLSDVVVAGMDKDEVQYYALKLVERVIDLHHNGHETNLKMLRAWTAMSDQFPSEA